MFGFMFVNLSAKLPSIPSNREYFVRKV